MKASEYITALQELIDQHGDLELIDQYNDPLTVPYLLTSDETDVIDRQAFIGAGEA